MTKQRFQDTIIKFIGSSATLKGLTSAIGGEYQEKTVANEILSMARKNLIAKSVALRFLKGTPNEKFLNLEFGSQLVSKKKA